ncbi:MAG: DUF2800 domain-containing protein [Pantoea ananatis]|nr:DUF2800 domain-containing protein [Pantoea ananatis]
MDTVVKKKKPVVAPAAPVKKKKQPVTVVSQESVTTETLELTPPKKKKAAVIPVKEIAEPAPAHALLSPSYSKTWLNCAASLAAGIDEPNVSGAAAVEGTLCHAVLECIINRRIWAEANIPAQPKNEGRDPADYVGLALLSDHPKQKFNEDQAKLLQPMVDYVQGLLDAGYTVFPEMRIDLTAVLHPGLTVPSEGTLGKRALKTFGTADLIAFKDDHLIVGDLKMGRNAVSPGTLKELNTQMALYGAGVEHKYRAKNFRKVTLLIAQPRAGGLKFLDDIPVAALHTFAGYAQTRALAAYACVEKGKKKLVAADFNPTPGGCEWCRFRDKCSAKLKVVTGAESTSNEISDAELFEAWKKIPLLESQIKSTQAEVLKRLLAGHAVGDLKVVQGSMGNRKWANEKDAEQYLLGKLYAKAYDKKLITPTAAAKLLPEDKELDKLITRAQGGPAVTTADDKRAAYSPVTNSDLDD